MPRDTATCGHCTSNHIIEGTYYADEERNKINDETDPKRGENSCMKKLTKQIKKKFKTVWVEFPSIKVLRKGQAVGMNYLKDNGAEKSDAAITSGYELSGQNNEIAQEHCFSICPPSAMHVASGSRAGEDWHVSRATVPTFGTDPLFFLINSPIRGFKCYRRVGTK